MSNAQSQFSVIEYTSKQERTRCGYCHSSNTSYSYGMIAHALTVYHYQSLIDRGWRRSGNYCYKPMMDVTCCPHYTIRCEALNFKISKSQKKVLKRMLKFLKNGLSKDEERASPIECDEDIERNMEVPDFSKYAERAKQNAPKMQVTSVSDELCNRLSANVNNTKSSERDRASTSTCTKRQLDESFENLPSQSPKLPSNETSRLNFDPCKGPTKKAKLLRLERKEKRLLAQGKTQEEIDFLTGKTKPQNIEKTLEDYFQEIDEYSDKLQLRLVRTLPASDGYKNSAKESFELYKKYQLTVHHDKIERLTEDAYKRFMGKSPLREWSPYGELPQGYGSFHEQYWLNGTLIAVAVLDILPYCVSSVYFFYDPTYAYLSLGTFSSLREVFLTRQLHKYAPNLQYYYMGYYIHSCPKMRYKAKIQPSKLLCPETYIWLDINRCLPKLNISKYSRLNDNPSAIDEAGVVDIHQVLLLYRNKTYTYGIFKTFHQRLDEKDDREVKEYASLVGRGCAIQMLYFID